MLVCRPGWVGRLPRPVALPLKAIIQFSILLWMLLVSLPRPDVILLQLPPALPTMMVCWAAARRHGARLVFDWHNFAYTLMGLTLGPAHFLVRVAERYERYWGKKADANMCVTHAMQEELAKGWDVSATVFHDRPPEFFKKASVAQQHSLFSRLAPAIGEPMHPNDFAVAMASNVAPVQKGKGTRETVRTVLDGTGAASLRPDRPALIVTSTSWTPDEDFGVLLAAALQYEEAAAAASRSKPSRSRAAPKPSLPRLLIFVTGRGPQRAEFEAQMRRLDLRYVAFRTVWLEPRDYPVLLGCADLGVSLHASSSGLDLPMKVVDMFGCSLPVCALSYSCIGELVQAGRNGLLFSTPQELAADLIEVLTGFPGGEEGPSAVMARLQEGAAKSSKVKWHGSWVKTALPVILGRE